MSDILSFSVVEHIRFFHGAIQLTFSLCHLVYLLWVTLSAVHGSLKVEPLDLMEQDFFKPDAVPDMHPLVSKHQNKHSNKL